MAGFSSEDDLINQISVNGKFWRADWNKLFNPTAAAVAGEWHTLFRGGGNPTADAIFNAGTALLAQQVYDVRASAGCIQHGGNVDAAGLGYKQLLNASGFSASATSMPGVLMLVDVLQFYRVTTMATTTARTTLNGENFTANAGTDLITYALDWPTYTKVRFTTSGTLPAGLALATDYWLIRTAATTSNVATSLANAVAGTFLDITDAGSGTHTLTVRLPRYADGAGVQALFFNNNSTAMGAGTPNLTLPSYTNAAGTAARATPATPSAPVGKTAATNSHILYSGATAAGKFGPFVPLAAGDTGIRSIEQIRNDATYTSNEYSVAMVKPLITLPLTTIGVAGEREFKSQLPSLPRVYDGAALYWLYYSGANTPANSAFYGHLDLGWS